jgi:alkylhydroperoxidase family enzyme
MNSMSRIAPLQSPYPAAIQQDFERIMGAGRTPLVLFRTIATQERAWKKFTAGGLLDKGPLPMREREIVINRTCANNGCEYEWGVHITAFAAHVKLNEEQVRATVLEAADAACWSASEQVLIATVDALHARASLTDDEFATLAAHYEEAQILEILLLCGFYRTVAYLANGLKLPIEDTAARFPKA